MSSIPPAAPSSPEAATDEWRDLMADILNADSPDLEAQAWTRFDAAISALRSRLSDAESAVKDGNSEEIAEALLSIRAENDFAYTVLGDEITRLRAGQLAAHAEPCDYYREVERVSQLLVDFDGNAEGYPSISLHVKALVDRLTLADSETARRDAAKENA